MSKVAPANEEMTRGVIDQPANPSNGCCMHCCGKAPGAVDVGKITRDGGKWIQHADGRIVEYWLYGSDDPDARTLVQIAGSLGTAFYNANLENAIAKMKELKLRGISITIPGQGYTSMMPLPYSLSSAVSVDMDAVLKAEGITGPLLVEGSSYGAAFALAAAHHFGERVEGVHLHVPYLNYELRAELGMTGTDLKTQDDACLDKDSAWANSCGSCGTHCGCCCVSYCVPTFCPGALEDAFTKGQEEAQPGATKLQMRDVLRASRSGANAWGLVHNVVGGVITKNWGFDVREVTAPKKVMISYNEGDAQCSPAHARWLQEHFTQAGAAVKVNVGGEGMKGNTHAAQQHKLLSGEFVELFAAM